MMRKIKHDANSEEKLIGASAPVPEGYSLIGAAAKRSSFAGGYT